MPRRSRPSLIAFGLLVGTLALEGSLRLYFAFVAELGLFFPSGAVGELPHSAQGLLNLRAERDQDQRVGRK